MNLEGVSLTNLNPTQRRILLEMEKRDRLAVLGGPGTGKTFIALFAILHALQEKKNCSFIVYNKNLNVYIKKLIGEKDFPSYLARTYHSWISHYLVTVLTNMDFDKVKKEFIVAGHEYEYDWPKIESHLNSISNDKKRVFDFIFVDEAQDIPLPLLGIIRQASKKLLVTFDDSQKIGSDYFKDQHDQPYDRSEILSTLELHDSFFDLTENYRNTKSIEAVAKLFGEYFQTNAFSLKKSTATLKGPLPRLIQANHIQHMQQWIYEDYLLHPDLQIGVLFPNTRLDADLLRLNQFREAMHESLKENSAGLFFKYGTWNNIQSFSQPGIYFMSMNSSKGLEFDHVYILDTDRLALENKEQANLMYVACTRAKKNLTFLFEEEKPQTILTILTHNPLLINRYDLREYPTVESLNALCLELDQEVDHE
jgi:superfamily I DNA/RNA helicase